ncbi:MAG: hypothetical protein E7083_01220 [Bacteroidales bacterium]|nr:hypothetical protein [Bacteroidales bacterium]
MRKILFFIIISLLFSYQMDAQNTVIIQNSTTSNKVDDSNSKVFYIQGIPSTENIGGVDVYTEGNPDPYGNPYMRTVYFENYRNIPVTVLYVFTVGRGGNEEEREGSITLGPKKTKSLDRRYNSPKDFKLIVRAL